MTTTPARHGSSIVGMRSIAAVLALWLLAALPAVEATNGAFTAQAANASSLATATLPPPDNVQATALDDERIQVGWTASAFPHIAAYEVYRSTVPGGGHVLIHTTAPGETAFEDSGLEDETDYYYVVRAIYGNWQSTDSVEASATTEPAP
jgi:large repetitive protein